MANWTCEQCALPFVRDKAGERPVRFCGQPCYRAWRAASGVCSGQFHPGFTPWNKGRAGIHLSPTSEWKKGQRSRNWLPVGSETVRSDKNGTARAYIKIAEPAKWRERALVVWEKEHGSIPRGYVIHHKDRNALNDVLDNLQSMTRAEHIAEHRSDLLLAKRAA